MSLFLSSRLFWGCVGHPHNPSLSPKQQKLVAFKDMGWVEKEAETSQGNHRFGYAPESFLYNKKCDSEPQAVTEGIIWPAWQLKSNPPMAVSPQLQPGQLPQIDRHRCAFTGRKGLSQSHYLCSYLHSKFSILQGLTEKVGCSPASKFLSLLGGGFISNPQCLSHYNKLVINNK